MTAFLKIYPIPKIRNIPIYRLAYSIAMYRNTSYRNPCIVIRIVSPDSCQYTALITTHNVLSRSLIGFLPNYRTSDHIYTLHTLIEKHVNQDKGKIYACFIDFKKAFDSIWHQGLFYKLIESGIGGKTYDLIKSMYTESKCGVKINTKRTRYLSQERGVRQGCCLTC